MNEKNKIETLMEWLLAVEAFFSINPYFLWETYSHYEIFDIVKKIIEISIICLFFFRRTVYVEKKSNLMVLSFLIIYIFYYFNVYPGELDIGVGIFTKLILLIIFLLLPSSNKKNIFIKFTVILSFSLISSLFFWFINILGINVNGDYIEANQIIKVSNNQHYLHYFGCVFRENIYYSPSIKQLCGMFDEPGMVGTICALVLIGNKFMIKKNKILFILLIAGIFSFSLAFYIIVSLYFIFYLISTGKMKKNHLFMIVFVICIILFMANNEYFQIKIFSRLNITQLINNNRTSEEFDVIFLNFLHSKDILFGVGNYSPVLDIVDAASYKVLIYSFGFIGFILIVGWFFYWGFYYTNKNKDSLLLVAFFILSIYQRPWIIYMYFIVILFGGIANLKYQKIE